MKSYILSSAVPLILIFMFCVSTISFINKSEDVVLKEKVVDMVTYIDGEAVEVADMIAIDNDWREYDYGTMLAHSAEHYDARPMTFAAAYDTEFNCISERHESVAGAPFDPWKYKEFTSAVTAAFPVQEEQNRPPYGEIEMPFTPGADGEPRMMHLYFRWIPDNMSDPYLLVAAISKHTVENSAKDTFYFQMIVIAMIAAALSVISSILQRKALQEHSTDWKKIRERAEE